MTYLLLFLSFAKIGLFSIGGGYAAMPLIESVIVDENSWLTALQFADIVTIAEMTPGPIAINAATFVGTRIGGILGAVAATMGCVFPSFIIVLALAYIYYRFRGLGFVQGILAGLRPAVAAMILSADISLISLSLYGSRNLPSDILSIDYLHLAVFFISLISLRIFKVNSMKVMLFSGLVGIILYFCL